MWGAGAATRLANKPLLALNWSWGHPGKLQVQPAVNSPHPAARPLPRSNRQLPVFVSYIQWFQPKYVLMENVTVRLGCAHRCDFCSCRCVSHACRLGDDMVVNCQ